jgi:hypothetical protein
VSSPRGNEIPRRSLLKRGLLGGVLLAIGGAIPLSLRSTRLGSPPRQPLKLLSVEEHAVLAAVAARLVPGPSAGPRWPTAEALDCAGKVDALLARIHPEAGAEFKQLLHLVENALGGLLIAGSPTTFTHAAPAEQDARLDAWRTSHLALLRSGYQAVKRLVHASYYSAPEVYALVGYPGPPAVPEGPA